MAEAKLVWVHIRTSEYGQAMYIDGKQKALDDIMMDVPDIFRVLKETIGNEPHIIDFTYDDVTDFERSMNISNLAILFPETIRREDIVAEEV